MAKAQQFLSALLLSLCFIIAAPLAAQERDVAQGSDAYVYEVDRLQNGAGSQDLPLQLDTPLGLLETFMEAGAEGRWADAAAALDYQTLEAGGDVDREQVAAQLYDLLYRSLSIDWAGLPDRPDAVDTLTSSEDPMAGTPRRSLRVGVLMLEGRPKTIRIARVQEAGGEPLWVFSRQTVANVPALYEVYGPTRFEEALPAPLRKQAFFTLAWWEVLALPLILLAGAIAAALTYRAIGSFRERADEDSRAYGVLQAIHMPVTLLAFAGTFAVVRETFFRLSGPARDVLDPIQILLVVAAGVAIILSVLEALFNFATSRRTDELEAPDNHADRNFYTRLSALRRIVTAVVLLAGIGIIIIASNLSNTLGFSIIASAGALGLVLVFAARKALGDIMASVQIGFAKTARIGDAVQFAGQWCYVEKIGFTHLQLRTWDERRIIAPVSSFTSESFENWTKQDASLMVHIELELDNRADVDQLRSAFRDFVREDDDVIDPDDAKCEVIDQNAKAMIVRFMARSPDPKTGWAMHCRMRENLLAAASRFDAGAGNEPVPAFIAREREVRMDAEG
ncbi:mechanosensitive ion channel family protein [Aurantiacibacter gangjinensis]|uniref:Mechanosensitive ion channel protein MscS n=1 Tax=Aurantiacibacter gangjinensis TaxID=502682 RepID=A0A0G9MRB8_9SPHN|nr:mechanosensitive ion channel domain-containing protein [Aurantiacibacter gangjinensis]APE29184.1 MscS Mechanosensitive ion channel [Aurantiacibacter gangjinensis]KLE33250.1 mechanosensitive ion channel protein MscS [Aurantiacibacter gangjinensis]